MTVKKFKERWENEASSNSNLVDDFIAEMSNSDKESIVINWLVQFLSTDEIVESYPEVIAKLS